MTKKHDKKCPLVQRLRFPEFHDAGEWEEVTVTDLLTESCQIGSKGNKAKKLTVKLWGKGVFEKEETFQGSVNTQYYRRRAGQFIYSKLDFLNQAFGIIPHYLDGFESTADLPCFDFRSDVNPVFFLEYVKREAFYKKLGEIADGGRKAKRIQVDVFLSFPVLLPPQTKEQQKIADCLSSLDERIDAETSKLERLKEHKKGLLGRLFPAEGERLPRLRFPEFRDAGEWKKNFLDEYSEVVRGGSPRPIDNFLTTKKDGLNWLKIGDINKEAKYVVATTEKVRAEALSKTREISPGDLILSNSMSFGRPYISKIKTCIHDGWIAITKISKKLHVEYLYYLISSPFSQQYFTNNAAGSGVQNLNADIIKSLPIFFPNILEQQRIADCLSSLDELITAQTQKIVLLKEHKKGLMQQLFPRIDEVLA
ncbi:restriction endonuclease subunit S [Desulfovibrio sp. ZJ369]|uniref:restriction endonuclease subunit S n=1 Tax=Desulfovibrio sp. ZJ369 TaxID=2709793 RepID=UPI0013E9DF7C|nr:restriction endonuclease subunit S [Desulfovibrio sp. ZJ369]